MLTAIFCLILLIRIPKIPSMVVAQLLPTSDGSNPLLRHEGDSCRIGKQLFVYGGRETNVVEFFDPETNTWSQAGDSPVDFPVTVRLRW